ncbi:MAG: hypothetical protein ACYCZO_12060, partial [Daejeonella sp.]
RDSKIGGKPVNQKYAEYYLSYYQDKLEFVREAPELFNKNETPVTQECDSVEGSNSPHIKQNELAIYLKYTNVIVTPDNAKAIAAEFGVHLSCNPQSFYSEWCKYGRFRRGIKTTSQKKKIKNTLHSLTKFIEQENFINKVVPATVNNEIVKDISILKDRLELL